MIVQEDSRGEIEQEEEESLDSRGIAGWDKVDHLACSLIGLSGLSVSNPEAKEIKRLYDNLLPYDKEPLRFKPHPHQPSRGRFARSKGGHVGIDQMKR